MSVPHKPRELLVTVSRSPFHLCLQDSLFRQSATRLSSVLCTACLTAYVSYLQSFIAAPDFHCCVIFVYMYIYIYFTLHSTLNSLFRFYYPRPRLMLFKTWIKTCILLSTYSHLQSNTPPIANGICISFIADSRNKLIKNKNKIKYR